MDLLTVPHHTPRYMSALAAALIGGCLKDGALMEPAVVAARIPREPACHGSVEVPADCAISTTAGGGESNILHRGVHTEVSGSVPDPSDAPRCDLVDNAGAWAWSVKLGAGWSGTITCTYDACAPVRFVVGPDEADTHEVSTYFVLETNYEVLSEWTAPDGTFGGTLRPLPPTPCPDW